MARSAFQLGIKHPARLSAVRRKPLENKCTDLLRLEFEIFRQIGADRLKSTGKVASRDIAIGRSTMEVADPGVRRYAQALGVRRPERLDDWISLEDRRPWVSIEFGGHDKRDMRNPFHSIYPFNPVDLQIEDFPYDQSLDWVTVGQAAKQLGCSQSKIRRLVDSHKLFHGGELVQPTPGGHRRINVMLLRNLL